MNSVFLNNNKIQSLKPCPFCGGHAEIGITDYEGNPRDESYLEDPWSGLSFVILHGLDISPKCPIANHPGEQMGALLHSTHIEAIEAWNNRI